MLSRIPRRATVALAEALSKQELERFTSDTSATDTEDSKISDNSQPSTTSAIGTIKSGTGSTVWEQSGHSFVEQPNPVIPTDEWLKLSPSHAFKLFRVAEGRGERPEDTIHAAVLWLMENDAVVAEVGTLKEIVEFYLDNMVV